MNTLLPDIEPGSPPKFLNGRWWYSKPVFDSLPEPNREVILMGWADDYTLMESGWESHRKLFSYTTPPDCNLELFSDKVFQSLGWNYCGWVYANNAP